MTATTYNPASSVFVVSDIVKRNRAIDVNPPNPAVDFHITSDGSSWLWAAFSLFAVFAIIHVLIYAFTSARRSGLKKALLIIPLFTNAIFAFAYYTYASNLGYTWIPAQFHHVGEGNRQIFYCKFIAWFLGWPLVLAIFQIVTNTSFTHADEENNFFKKFLTLFELLFTRVLAIEVFVLGLLIGALIESSYKWGYFTFAVVFQLFAMYLVAKDIFASFKSSSHSSLGNLLILAFFVVWILYPICWALSEGGNVIQPDSEAVFYGILDLITFGIIPILLTWLAIKNVDEDFFSKLWHTNKPREHGVEEPHPNDGLPDAEKTVGETPRHSGDTAVAPSGVPEQTAADAERAADAAERAGNRAADDATAATRT
ncbi:heat shock protein [Candida viswanathii]|uniref:Heat shock protein n=1 Tax=Candida viswanathii TaxID=5486 RepID=A0A367XRE0_9ASCO|nr:heat shock protein [Candida viswanathii]